MEIKNFYRLGTVGEKSLFEDMKEYYSGIVIGAHFAAFYPDWSPTFLSKVRKPFFIDPMTYVFARNLDNIKKEDNFKKSYEKLINVFEKNIRVILEKRQLIPRDFLVTNTKLIEEFTKSIINFQKNIFKALPSQQSILEYAEILGKTAKAPTLLFLTTPYFYFTSIDDPWYEISIKIAKHSIKLKKEHELYVILCFSKELLCNEEDIDRIVKDYTGFDGYLIWISDFDEKNESEEYLSGLKILVEKLSEFKKPIYTLYGEFFSLLLSKFGLAGYSRGISYGESKSVDAVVTGGRPPRRYYLSLFHTNLSETIARTFFSDNPNLLCTCRICSDILKSIKSTDNIKTVSQFFDNIDFPKEAKQHFMIAHTKEMQRVSKSSLDDLKKELKKQYEICEKLNPKIYGVPYKHIKRWEEVLGLHTTNRQ